jgi:hypothetical protein
MVGLWQQRLIDRKAACIVNGLSPGHATRKTNETSIFDRGSSLVLEQLKRLCKTFLAAKFASTVPLLNNEFGAKLEYFSAICRDDWMIYGPDRFFLRDSSELLVAMNGQAAELEAEVVSAEATAVEAIVLFAVVRFAGLPKQTSKKVVTKSNGGATEAENGAGASGRKATKSLTKSATTVGRTATKSTTSQAMSTPAPKTPTKPVVPTVSNLIDELVATGGGTVKKKRGRF